MLGTGNVSSNFADSISESGLFLGKKQLIHCCKPECLVIHQQQLHFPISSLSNCCSSRLLLQQQATSVLLSYFPISLMSWETSQFTYSTLFVFFLLLELLDQKTVCQIVIHDPKWKEIRPKTLKSEKAKEKWLIGARDIVQHLMKICRLWQQRQVHLCVMRKASQPNLKKARKGIKH